MDFKSEIRSEINKAESDSEKSEKEKEISADETVS